MRRAIRLVLLILLVGIPAGAHAQSPPPASPPTSAAQDGFVPVSQLPPTEQLPAGPLVLGAYGFMWAAVLVYVWSLSRRLSDVGKDLDALKRRQG